MKKFLKQYLGLIGAVALAGGSLFAFNISTSIDNALQVIKTIWVTSDGTTSNPPFVTMDGSGKYVSIGTTWSGETLSVSGSLFTKDNETILFAGNNAGNALGYPIPGAMLGIDATASSGATAAVTVYDTRAVESNGKLGINIASNANIGINGAAAEASINMNEGDNIDMQVEQGFDYSNYDEPNQSGFVISNNRSEITIDPDHINISAETGIVRTLTSGGNYNTDYVQGTHIEVDYNYLKIYGSGGFADLYFNPNLGLFGFAQNNPGNTVDIGGGYVPGTLGLRFSGRAGNAGQVLGLNNDGDVVLLGTLGGGGGGPTGPWEYGAGSPQSAQIMGAGNTSNGPRSVVGGLNNIGDGYAAFVGGGLYNEALSSGNVAVGGAYNKSHGLLLSTIVGGTYNTINSGGNVSFIGGGSDNTINERNSAILVGSNNTVDGTSSTIAGGEYNTISSSLSIIGGGSGNFISGSRSTILGGIENAIAGLYGTIVAGANNIVNGNYGFVGGGYSNVLAVGALYSLIVGGENNSVTDRYSSIVGGLNNVIQSEKSFIGGGEDNMIETNNGLSAIVAGSDNRILSGSNYALIGGGLSNTVNNAPASFIGGGLNNNIESGGPDALEYPNVIAGGSYNTARGIVNTIAGGYKNTVDGTLFTIGGGNNNSITADGDGSTIAGGTSNTITGAGNKNFIGGGQFNTIEYGSNSTIGGGGFNVISGTDSTIPGGRNNVVIGGNSFAAGQYASALHDNTFVWNSNFSSFASLQSNTFLVNAQNGVGINTNDTNSKALRVNGSVQANSYYSANNNQGMTTTLTNIGGGGCTMTFENGLLVSTSGC